MLILSLYFSHAMLISSLHVSTPAQLAPRAHTSARSTLLVNLSRTFPHHFFPHSMQCMCVTSLILPFHPHQFLYEQECIYNRRFTLVQLHWHDINDFYKSFVQVYIRPTFYPCTILLGMMFDLHFQDWEDHNCLLVLNIQLSYILI